MYVVSGAAAHEVVLGVVPRGRQLRAGVGAVRAVRAAAGDLGLGGVGLDRDVAADVVLVEVRALGPDRARRRALALGARGVALQRLLGRLLGGDVGLDLGADAVDVVLVVDRLDGRIAARLGERLLLVGHPRADEHAAVAGGLDRMVHVEAQRLEVVVSGLARQLELDQCRILRPGERRTRRHQHRSRDRDCPHPWPHRPSPSIDWTLESLDSARNGAASASNWPLVRIHTSPLTCGGWTNGSWPSA